MWLDAVDYVGKYYLPIYDANGNPVDIDSTYYHWTNGRQLSHITYDDWGVEDELVSYTYDDNGIRTSKSFGKTVTYYTNVDGAITSQYQLEENGDVIELIEFLYDSADELIGFTYDGNTYFYVKNVQGDVTAVLDSTGMEVASYDYTAYGQPTDYVTGFAAVNPMRYRGYYYDDDFGAYYLQSRYYSPEFGRFLNSDLPEYAQVQKNDHYGINLFAYCCNDPINYVDPTGQIAISTCVLIGVGIGALVGAICGAGVAISKGYKVKNGFKFWKYVLGGIVIGGTIGGILGYVGGALFGASGIKAGTLASKISMSKVRAVGKYGEKLAKISKNTTRINSATHSARYRIPDILDKTNKYIGDVKYVKYLSYTKQLQDFYAYAVQKGYTFILCVRPETKLSKTLQNMVDAGKIIIYYITK